MFQSFKGKVRLFLSGLKEEDGAVLGASALIWNELDKQKTGTLQSAIQDHA